MSFLWPYLSRYKKLFALALVLAAINQVFSLLDPQILRLLIDRYASHASDYTSGEFVQGVLLLLLASVGVALVSRLAKNFQDYYLNVITQRLGTRMYSTSVAHSFSLPFSAFEDERSGELLGKLQKARADTQTLVMGAVNTVFLSLVGIVFVLSYAFTVHWSIGLLFFLIIPSLGTVTFLLSRSIKRAQENIVRETVGLAGSTTETLRNVELVKSLGLEEQEIQRLNTVNETILSLELRKIVLIRRLGFLQGTIVNATRSGLLFLLLWLISRGDVSIGQFFSLLIYSFFIFTPLADIATVSANYQEARASVDTLNRVLKTPPEAKPEHPKEVGVLDGISFANVSFRHSPNVRPALTDVSLNVKAGETIAFVGPSGSGKTTTVKLLVGLYRPTEGEITVNGISFNDIDLEKFRGRMGLVSQETQLFSGTIRENLQFVRPDATDEECFRALEEAEANNILSRTADGLNARIGEGGMKLSGGEKQRLAIARALLRQPDLIIFDEATSSLDSLTEKAITTTIRHISTERKQLTSVLVAHRLSTIAHADTIYVLEKGRIVEHGPHQELLDKKGLYYAMWREQQAVSDPEDASPLARST